MTYQDFRKTYYRTLKKYPGMNRIYFSDMYTDIGYFRTVNYEKKGSRWVETGRRVEKLTPAFYCNSVDAMPFFRNIGGYERAELGYTYYGYLPHILTSINPDRTKKIVRTFFCVNRNE